jgi:hypothetical protein
MNPIIILLLAAAVVAIGIVLYRRYVWGDVTIPMPAILRTDLHFGYYLSTPGQLAKTADHVDMFWHAQFYDSDQLAIELKGLDIPVVLDCARQLFRRDASGKSFVSDTAAADLHALFSGLKDRGLLAQIKYLSPMDEPNLFCASEAELRQAVGVLKAEAGRWTELSGVQYLCNYGENTDKLWCFDAFDRVGVDCYGEKSEALTRGAHADLMQSLLPHQKVFILPGAAYGQDPTPFIAYAHSEPRVWAVIPFIWAHIPASADKEGWTGLEKQPPEAQERYRQAGLMTLNKKEAQ